MKLSEIEHGIIVLTAMNGTYYPDSMGMWRFVERLADRTGYLMENGNMDGFILTVTGEYYLADRAVMDEHHVMGDEFSRPYVKEFDNDPV